MEESIVDGEKVVVLNDDLLSATSSELVEQCGCAAEGMKRRLALAEMENRCLLAEQRVQDGQREIVSRCSMVFNVNSHSRRS